MDNHFCETSLFRFCVTKEDPQTLHLLNCPPPGFPVGAGKPPMGRDSLGSMLSESSTSDEEKRRSGSNERVSPERHDLTMVRRRGGEIVCIVRLVL